MFQQLQDQAACVHGLCLSLGEGTLLMIWLWHGQL